MSRGQDFWLIQLLDGNARFMIRADVDSSFFRRYLWIGIGCLAYALWCLYDGFIAYPSQLERAAAFEAIPDGAKRIDTWIALASKNGWPERIPLKSADELAGMISGQMFYATICILISGIALFSWFRSRGTWIEGDESKLRHCRGQEVPIDAITKIDKRKWAKKGIAKVTYNDGGRNRRFVLDDFKYHTASVRKLLAFAEANLEADQVTGDQLERDKVEPSTTEEPAESSDDVTPAADG